MTLTPDRIFSRMDACRAYAARLAETDRTAARPAQANPAPPQYAAPQPVQPPYYAQQVPQHTQLPKQYAQPQQYIPPQYGAPSARGFETAAEPFAPPVMSAVPENLPPEPPARRETGQLQRPRSGTYSQLMASHDRMGTRHLG